MDPYTVLGLAPGAPVEDAEAAYRRLLRIHHPDLHQDAPESVRSAAELRTMALNAAIREIRRSSARPTVGARRTAEPPRATPGRDDRPPASPFGFDPWGADEPLAACPLCGEWFSTAPGLKAHVAAHAGWGRRSRPRRARRPRLPLTVLVCVNVLIGLFVVGTIQRLGGDGNLAAWVFALSLAPSLIRLVAGEGRW